MKIKMKMKMSQFERMVTIDEEERESLRRLAEDDDVHHHTARGHPSKNKGDEVPSNNKKLETKKSEDINESAEKFIQNFRQELLIQRLESIENYDKMLARGL